MNLHSFLHHHVSNNLRNETIIQIDFSLNLRLALIALTNDNSSGTGPIFNNLML